MNLVGEVGRILDLAVGSLAEGIVDLDRSLAGEDNLAGGRNPAAGIASRSPGHRHKSRKVQTLKVSWNRRYYGTKVGGRVEEMMRLLRIQDVVSEGKVRMSCKGRKDIYQLRRAQARACAAPESRLQTALDSDGEFGPYSALFHSSNRFS